MSSACCGGRAGSAVCVVEYHAVVYQLRSGSDARFNLWGSKPPAWTFTESSNLAEVLLTSGRVAYRGSSHCGHRCCCSAVAASAAVATLLHQRALAEFAIPKLRCGNFLHDSTGMLGAVGCNWWSLLVVIRCLSCCCASPSKMIVQRSVAKAHESRGLGYVW